MNNNTPPHNPHDRFFRSAMENRAVARGFMQYYLPSDIRQALDLDSLRLESDSYIDTALQEAISDLVLLRTLNTWLLRVTDCHTLQETRS